MDDKILNGFINDYMIHYDLRSFYKEFAEYIAARAYAAGYKEGSEKVLKELEKVK